MPRPSRAAALAAFLSVALTGCGLVDRSGDDEAGEIIDEAVRTPSPTETPAAAAATPAGPLPTTCEGLVPYARVLDALAAPLDGDSRYVFADALPSANRLGRVTCTYGIVTNPDGTKAPPRLEITVNAYADTATATDRLGISLDDARGRGQTVESLELNGRPGYVVADPIDISYLMVERDRTVVVTLARGIVPDDALQPALLGIAGAVVGIDPFAATGPETPPPAAPAGGPDLLPDELDAAGRPTPA